MCSALTLMVTQTMYMAMPGDDIALRSRRNP
jgi:hypothetical protein